MAAIAIGTLYAINAWSFPVIAGLVLLGGLVRVREARRMRERVRTLSWVIAALLLAVIAVLPFLLTYDAAADGLGRVTERASFSRWASDHGALYGLFAYLVATAYAVRLARSRHPWRTAGWTAAAALFVGSLLATADLVAVGGLVALVWVAAHAAFLARAPAVERFVWVLIGGGLLCLLIPEVVYVKDSFDGSDLYRMNTVFKLGYQAWLLLAIAGSAVDRLELGVAAAGARGSRRSRGGCRCWPASRSSPSIRWRARTRARTASRRRRTSAGCAGWRRRRRATRPRSSGCATTRPAARSCSSPSATTTPPSATRASRPSRACRP